MSETERQTRTTTRERQREPEVTEALLERVVEATVARVEARTARPNPMMLNTFEDIENFAQHAAKTGEMVPKDYRGKPDNIILAVMKGNELGMPPIQAIESIAIIDGRSTIYGEAVPGLCWASGKVESIEEFFEGDEGTDGFTAVCIARRRGNPHPFVGKFSQKDAKIAGLYGKRVHGAYPKRMMQWRARSALHDAFPDVLKGLAARELVEEDRIAAPAWTMPRPQQSWFARKATAKSDGWDDTWFNGFVGKLLEEQNAWRWLEVLTTGLTDAPTLRDVEEIGDLPVVQETQANAPDEAKNTISAAFTAARARFASATDKQAPPPAQDSATQAQATKPQDQAAPASEATQAPATPAAPSPEVGVAPEGAASGGAEFAHWLLDEAGEPVDEFTDPFAFADSLRSLYAKSGNKLGLLEQNADAIDDAEKDTRAKAVLDEFTDAGEDAPLHISEVALPEIALPVVRGAADWKTYISDFKAAVAQVGAEQYLDWLATQHRVFDPAPPPTRLLIVKACVIRAKELGLEPPAILQQTAPAAPAAPPAQSTVQEQPTETAPSPPPTTDRDARTVATLLAELAKCKSTRDVDTWKQHVTVIAVRGRFTSEGKADRLKQLDDAEEAMRQQLRFGA